MMRVELTTSAMRMRRSSQLSYVPETEVIITKTALYEQFLRLLRAAHPRARVEAFVLLIQDAVVVTLNRWVFILLSVREPWCAKLGLITRFCLIIVNY